jgi:hypothetical protein
MRRKITLRLLAGHVDRVGGWKPLGDFFFFQAMVVAIPAAFLAVWLVLIPLPVFQARYGQWQDPYVGLLTIAIVLEILAFVIPLWVFHQRMVAEKRALQHDADALWPKIAAIQSTLANPEPDGDVGALKETRDQLLERHQAIEDLPVWPLGKRTKRLFGINNLVLFLPMISQYAGLSEGWAAFLKGLFSGIGG